MRQAMYQESPYRLNSTINNVTVLNYYMCLQRGHLSTQCNAKKHKSRTCYSVITAQIKTNLYKFKNLTTDKPKFSELFITKIQNCIRQNKLFELDISKQ
jgi:hypothetical protein